MVQMNWPSFGVGFGAGVLTTAAAYRVWQVAQRMRQSEEDVARRYTVRNADPGYIKALVEYAERAHLFGHRAKLQKMLVPPTFLRAPDLPTPPGDDDSMRDPYELVPIIHDYPALHTPFFLRTLDIDDLGRSAHPIAILGDVGSGRTTALLSLALRSAGFLDFPEEADVVQEQLEEQEAELSRTEQADRIKQRMAMMERAQQRYVDEAGETVSGDKFLGDTSADRAVIQQHAPVYIHLADVQLSAQEFGRRVDPAEPLVRGLQKQVGRMISMRMVQRMYNLLESGNALLLIDGYDDLPETDRTAAMAWIESLIQTYSNNHIVLAMPLHGYGKLVEMGVVPVFLRPWNQTMRLKAAQQWTDNWESFGRGKLKIDSMQFENEAVFHAHLAEETRLQHALDSTLHTWTILENAPADPSGAMQAYLLEHLPEAEEILPDLLFMATTQLDTGYFQLSDLVERALAAEGLEALATEEETEESAAEEFEADDSILDAYYDDVSGVQQTSLDAEAPSEEAPAGEPPLDEKALRKRQREITREQSQWLQKLVDAGILTVYRGGRYQFRHKLLCAYLGSLWLAEAEDDVLHEKYQLPDWKYALRYTNQQRDLTPLVMERLQSAPDVLHEHVLSLTHWLRYMGDGAQWRNEFLKYIGGLFIAEDQYTVVRERVAAALLYSGDRGAGVIFRHALKNPMSDVRILGCLGVGVLQDQAAIDALAKLVIEDAVDEVRIAAALGLGVMNSEEALVTLVDVLDISEDRAVRRAIAESLAAYPKEGYLTLYDAVQSKDYLLRRTAVYGLGRIPKDWALIKLNEVFLHDEQWFVQSAVQDVFEILYAESVRSLHPYPQPERINWLAEWAQSEASQDESAQEQPLLEQAVQQGDDLIRALSLMTAGPLCEVSMLDDLYGALRDTHPAIRDAAYRSLAAMQQQVGQPLPAPVN